MCLDHREYLVRVTKLYGLGTTEVDGFSIAVERLIARTNAESNFMKKKIFRTIRCLHCFQNTKGGVKCSMALNLPSEYTRWLDLVHKVPATLHR